MITVRPARFHDLAAVVGMVGKFVDELDYYNDVGRESDDIIRYVLRCMEHPDGLVLVGLVGIDPAGVLIAETIPFFFNTKKRFAFDQVVYVERKFRNTYLAARLVRTYEKWATDLGCWDTQLAPQNMDKRIGRILRRDGYRTVAYVTKKRIGD